MNGNCSDEHLGSAVSIALSVWFSLSGLAAVTGNVAALWLFYKNESLRTISNRFLASLSVADTFVGLVIDPVWIAIRCWIQPQHPSTLHTIMLGLWVHTNAATAFNVCCVSIDRFIAIRFPFRYQDILSKSRCFAVIILVWFISLTLPLSGMLEDKGMILGLYIVFVASLLVVFFCYIFIFKSARKQFKRVLVANPLPDPGENIRVRTMQNFKAIKTVGFVLGACIITWMPSLILISIKFYYVEAERGCNAEQIWFVEMPWAEAIAFTSSAINPFIYYIRNSDFRQAFRRTFFWLPYVHEQNSPDHSAQPERKQMERNVGTCTRGNLATKEANINSTDNLGEKVKISNLVLHINS